MVGPKRLYIAESITDLREKVSDRHTYNRSLTFERLQAQYERKKQEAERYLTEEGDQELAYIAYCNALEYLDKIGQCQEFLQTPRRVQTKHVQERAELGNLNESKPSRSVHRHSSNIYHEQRENYSTDKYTPQEGHFAVSRPSLNNLSSVLSEISTSSLPPPSSTSKKVSKESRPARIMPSGLSSILKIRIPTRECVVCLSDKPVSDFTELISSSCQHTQRQICKGCVRKNIRNEINNSSTTDIRCPEEGCGASLDFHTVRNLVLNLNTVLGRSKAAVDQYENKLSMKYVETMENFLWCAHGCGHGVQLADNQMVCYKCIHCKQKTCAQHRVRWHSDMTCSEYDEKLKSDREEQDNQSWIRDHTKKCPKCDSSIEKNKGCNHMTCLHCKNEFCWICLVNYKLVSLSQRQVYIVQCNCS
ncbi:hypothetical protein I4U23_015312 [Adineta vaga]|nr:hypothetical protein I4U23_015312 [Adineta vaga]